MKTSWDLFIIVLVLVNSVTIPLEMSFSDLEVLNSNWYNVMEVLINISFVLDIIVNFFTYFKSPKTGLFVTDRWEIAKNYMCGPRFTIDILASIPFEHFQSVEEGQEESSVQGYQNVTGLLKLFRLLRIGRLVTYMRIKDSFKLGFRIIAITFALIIIIHYIGCFWFLAVR